MRAKLYALMLGALIAPAFADTAAEPAEVLITQGLTADRDGATPQKSDKAKPERGDGVRLDRKGNPNRSSENINQEFWVFDAFATIRDDFDFDGFSTRVELTFDVDTVFNSADVFAVLYLSLEGGPWTEYGSTEVFRIFGASGNDEYFFDSDLVSGFPTGYYDILIEVYDTFDGRLVADFGPNESPDLFELPLESISLDSPNEPVVVVSSEGGGAAGFGTLGLLLGLLGLARRRVSLRDA